MASFDRSYKFLLAFHSNYCFGDKARRWLKITIFHTLPVFDAPIRWVPITVRLLMFATENLEWHGYPTVKWLKIILFCSRISSISHPNTYDKQYQFTFCIN